MRILSEYECKYCSPDGIQCAVYASLLIKQELQDDNVKSEDKSQADQHPGSKAKSTQAF